MKYIVDYFIFINILSYLMYYIDKKRSIKHEYRIKESTLLTLSLLGGFIGSSISMIINHHKTKKFKFHLINFLSLIIYTILLYVLITY